MPDDWDPTKSNLKVGSTEVTKLNSWESDPQDPLEHIETSQGVTGYKESYKKPKFSFEILATNPALPDLETMKTEKTRGVIVYDCPAFTDTLTDARISTITPAGDIKGAPAVKIEGLGLTHERVWKP